MKRFIYIGTIVLITILLFDGCKKEDWDPDPGVLIVLDYDNPYYHFEDGIFPEDNMPKDIFNMGIRLLPWCEKQPRLTGCFELTDESSFLNFEIPPPGDYSSNEEYVPLNTVMVFKLQNRKYALVKIIEDDYQEDGMGNCNHMITLKIEYPALTDYDETDLEPDFGSFIDTRDGNMYKTVKLGNQVWMAENLAYLPWVSSPFATEGSYCYSVYGYRGSNVEEAKATANYQNFGVLYSWKAAMDTFQSSNTNPSGVQGACPAGWHLPSKAEWDELIEFMVDNGYQYDETSSWNNLAQSLAAQSTWHKDDFANPGSPGYDTLANNKSGFSALPAGRAYFYSDYDEPSVFDYLGRQTYFWTSTSSTMSWRISYSSSSIGWHPNGTGDQFSVRCVMDGNYEMPSFSIETSDVSEITQTTAVLGGVITVDDSLDILAIGVCWNKLGAPLISDYVTEDEIDGNAFISYLTNLSPNTTYYVRSYVTTSEGTVYGDEISFKTLAGSSEIEFGTFKDSRDGYNYSTVKIGDQVWLAENLRAKHYLNWDPIKTTNPATLNTREETEPKYMWAYGGDEEKIDSFGFLYTWYAATDPRGLCPAGWHLPSDDEWRTLEQYLAQNGFNCDGEEPVSLQDGYNLVAKAMSLSDVWVSSSNIYTVGNSSDIETESYRNKSGFSAMPGGERSQDGGFSGIGSYACWWTATTDNSYNNAAFERVISYEGSNLIRSPRNKNAGLSIRCLQDEE